MVVGEENAGEGEGGRGGLMTHRLAGRTKDEGDGIWVDASELDYWMEKRLADEAPCMDSPIPQ